MVSLATASAHLARLVEGGLLDVYAQGRHRYYRLASQSVASALETLGALARSCYDHLAGELAIAIADDLVARRALTREGDGFFVARERGCCV